VYKGRLSTVDAADFLIATDCYRRRSTKKGEKMKLKLRFFTTGATCPCLYL
jgi:hypothetical protein